MKTLSKCLLFSVLVFLPIVGYAQDNFDLLLNQINKVQRQFRDKQFELEMKLADQQRDIQTLEKRQDALQKALENAKFDVEFLKSMRGFTDTKSDDTSKKLDNVESKLNETEEKLARAEEAIRVQNLRLLALEARGSKPRVPVSKPTPTANKGPH